MELLNESCVLRLTRSHNRRLSLRTGLSFSERVAGTMMKNKLDIEEGQERERETIAKYKLAFILMYYGDLMCKVLFSSIPLLPNLSRSLPPFVLPIFLHRYDHRVNSFLHRYIHLVNSFLYRYDHLVNSLRSPLDQSRSSMVCIHSRVYVCVSLFLSLYLFLFISFSHILLYLI